MHSYEFRGAYALSGVLQIAPEQLADMNIPWVILGHSERRSLLKETNDFVGAKAANALAHGLKVIACIGETLEQRESGQVGQCACTVPLFCNGGVSQYNR